MKHPLDLAQRARRRAWLAGWKVKDRLAGVGRLVSDGTVALTFDDGPHPCSTGRVLDVLGELGAVATFFCVGRNAQEYPHLVKRILAEGHAIGSHSQSHPDPAELSLEDLRTEYRVGRDSVANAVGQPVALFRPPHGHLAYRSAVMIRREKLSSWLWTVDTQDWRPGVSAEEVSEAASRSVSRDVVLLHDWVEQPEAPEAMDRGATLAALPVIVRNMRARGLKLVTIPSLVGDELN